MLIARDGEVIMKLSRFEEELPVPSDFSGLKGLISPISDKNWSRTDQELLDSIKYGDLVV